VFQTNINFDYKFISIGYYEVFAIPSVTNRSFCPCYAAPLASFTAVSGIGDKSLTGYAARNRCKYFLKDELMDQAGFFVQVTVCVKCLQALSEYIQVQKQLPALLDSRVHRLPECVGCPGQALDEFVPQR
jgi:hypothetical protein